MVDERRRNADRVEDKLDNLLNLLGEHISGEEAQIADIQKSIDKYFGEIDAHLHKYHHEYIDEEIEEKKQSKQWWNKLKQGIVEKILLVIIGAVVMYLGHVILEDVKNEVQKPPAITQTK